MDGTLRGAQKGAVLGIFEETQCTQRGEWHPETPKDTAVFDWRCNDRGKARVNGPFTVEAVPAAVIMAIRAFVDGQPILEDSSVADFSKALCGEAPGLVDQET